MQIYTHHQQAIHCTVLSVQIAPHAVGLNSPDKGEKGGGERRKRRRRGQNNHGRPALPFILF
jgi:hypothetical protein